MEIKSGNPFTQVTREWLVDLANRSAGIASVDVNTQLKCTGQKWAPPAGRRVALACPGRDGLFHTINL